MYTISSKYTPFMSNPLPLLNHCISSKLTTNNVYALHIIPSFIAAFCQWKGNPCMALIKNPSFSSSWRLTSTTHTLIFFPCFRRPAAWPQLQDVLAISFSASLPGLTRTRRSELVPPWLTNSLIRALVAWLPPPYHHHLIIIIPFIDHIGSKSSREVKVN